MFPKEAPTSGGAKGVLISGMRHFGCIIQYKALTYIYIIYLFFCFFFFFNCLLLWEKRRVEAFQKNPLYNMPSHTLEFLCESLCCWFFKFRLHFPLTYIDFIYITNEIFFPLILEEAWRAPSNTPSQCKWQILNKFC